MEFSPELGKRGEISRNGNEMQGKLKNCIFAYVSLGDESQQSFASLGNFFAKEESIYL